MWISGPTLLRKCSAASLVALGFVVPASASAMPAIALNPIVSPMAVAVKISVNCRDTIFTPPTVSPQAAQALAYSKSAAILGGEMSALERMRAEQSGQYAETAELSNSSAMLRLEPAATGDRTGTKQCTVAYSGNDRIDRIAEPAAVAIRNPDDFLASKRVRIGKTSFDREWRRVRSENIQSSRRPTQLLLGGTNLETVRGVNEWVNRNIEYVEDRDLFGRSDYWAGARKTLQLGKGDCEDIALTKMQLLAAAGFSRNDMFITIARDTIRRADHALLVVKVGDRYVVLDNATNTLLDGNASHGYAPVLSFAANKSWIHGY